MSAYNAENYLDLSIQSILSQTCKDFEFIIINDGSSDNTLNVIKSFQCKDNRIRIIDQDNQGLTKSLNSAINSSVGEYIARMDADDISSIDRLSLQADFLDNNKLIGMTGTWAKIIDSSGDEINKVKLPTTSRTINKRMRYGNQFIHGSAMFRKEVFLDVDGYDESFKFSQDYDLWLRIIKKSNIININKYLYFLRVHDDSISIKNNGSQLENAARCITKNICHNKLKYSYLPTIFCKCSVCNGNGINSNIVNEKVKDIVYARLLLRRGEFNDAKFYYAKVGNLESYTMLFLLKYEGITLLAKRMYRTIRSILDWRF